MPGTGFREPGVVAGQSLQIGQPCFQGLFPFGEHLGRLGRFLLGHLSQVPENCVDCHSLDSNEGENGTSYISSASRTLPTMKSLAGSAPASFGCTYCHSNDLNGTMKGILTHFGAKSSKHPVGKIRGGSETQNEYLSTWDTTFVNELDCIDCHDPLLVIDQNPANLALAAPYANHVTPNTGGRVGNPSMLRASGVMTETGRSPSVRVP